MNVEGDKIWKSLHLFKQLRLYLSIEQIFLIYLSLFFGLFQSDSLTLSLTLIHKLSLSHTHIIYIKSEFDSC